MSSSMLLKSATTSALLHKISNRFFSQTSPLNRVENVLILGSGLMGSGIAQSCATSGKFNSIVLQDINTEQLNKAQKRIATSLEKFKEKTEIDIGDTEEVLGRIKLSTEILPASEDNLLVIEAVPERIDLKLNTFRELTQQFKENQTVILATNTSVLPCSEIKKGVEAKDRFAALHFFNPVPQMKLVEIARTAETTEQTIDALKQFVVDIDHIGVVCSDQAGFIVNRLLGPYLREAQKMLDAGSATVQDIDTAMKLGAGYPMGPFELMDYIGLDTHLRAGEAYRRYNPEMEIYRSKLVESLVNRGHLGRKTGKGFYEYNKDGTKKA